MELECFTDVEKLTKELVSISSINKEPGGETAAARFVESWYRDLPYFRAHPDSVLCFQTENDFVVRHSTMAFVRGTKKRGKSAHSDPDRPYRHCRSR